MKTKILLFAFLIFAVSALMAKSARAHQVGQILTVKGVKYKIVSANKKILRICPDYSNFYGSFKPQGWFYGQSCRTLNIAKLQKKQENQKQHFHKSYLPPVANLSNYEYLNNLTAKEFKVFYHRMTEVAVMRPTEPNIAAYMTMTNFMRKKAVAFTYATMVYLLNHPSVDVQKKIGETSFSYDTYIQDLGRAQKSFIKKNSDRLGIIYFLTNKNAHQNHVENWLKRDYGIQVIGVAKHYCPSGLNFQCVVGPNVFKNFNVTYAPTNLLVYRGLHNTPHYQVIGSGLTTENAMAFRIYKFIKDFKQVYYNINPFQSSPAGQ
ncbi:MAG: conjugal transfer protein TraF [bacterium]